LLEVKSVTFIVALFLPNLQHQLREFAGQANCQSFALAIFESLLASAYSVPERSLYVEPADSLGTPAEYPEKSDTLKVASGYCRTAIVAATFHSCSTNLIRIAGGTGS